MKASNRPISNATQGNLSANSTERKQNHKIKDLDKKGVFKRFWDSSFGGRLAVGGPFKTTRLRNFPRFVPRKTAIRNKIPFRNPFSSTKWNEWTRKFVWNRRNSGTTGSEAFANRQKSSLSGRCDNKVVLNPNVMSANAQDSLRILSRANSSAYETSRRFYGSDKPKLNAAISKTSSHHFSSKVTPDQSRFLWKTGAAEYKERLNKDFGPLAETVVTDFTGFRSNKFTNSSERSSDDLQRKYVWRSTIQTLKPAIDRNSVENTFISGHSTSNTKTEHNSNKPTKRFVFNSYD